MFRLLVPLIAAAFIMTGCASVQRTLSYPATQADADVWVGGHRYAIWFHPQRPTLLVQRGPPQHMSLALAQNWTVYSNDESEPTLIWRTAADAVLQPIGCSVYDVTGQDQMREFTYRCQEGVNVMAAVEQHRYEWRQGVRVANPMEGQASGR